MKRKIAIALLATMMCSMTACSGTEEADTMGMETVSHGTESVATEETSTEGEEVTAENIDTAEAEPRYQPEWTKDAVIYEVNVRQYTKEGTFNAFSEHLQTYQRSESV